ncbi:hypothetical protein SLS58_006980 [Diplodia intermedia]|uniref:Ankyrin repeat protein n=1 Tax=Diplodia intermedia TaxID=856260 RepID=A0ABR3TLT0_9PEZI
MACGCEDLKYQWTISLFGKLIRITAGIREGGEMSIGWNMMPLNTVRRTSPGFVVIERCRAGTLTAADASHQVRALLDSGVISTKDQNPDGEGYIDYLIRGPWAGIVNTQFDLLGTFAQEGFLQENDRLLKCVLRWVGEGPHMCLLKEVLRLFDFTQGFRPETMVEWPMPFNPGYIDPFMYPDLLFIEAIGNLAAEDSALSHNFKATEEILRSASPSDLLARNFRGQSALHLAVRNPRMVGLLLKSRLAAHVDSTDKFGMTPLMYAASYGDINTTKSLLQAGADPFLRDGLRYECMWHYAFLCSGPGFLEEVLKFYMAMNPDDAGDAVKVCLWIRMLFDTSDYYDQTLEYLLQTLSAQGDICWDGFPLLHVCRDTDEAQLLLKYYHGSVNQQNGRGYTAMMVLSRFPSSARVLQKLVEHEADVSIMDNHCMSAFHHLNAAMMDRLYWGPGDREEWTDWLDATAVLVSAGGDINQGDKCCCPCSPTGCSPIRGLFREYDSRDSALQSIPWVLEHFMVLKHTAAKSALVQATANLHRFQTFEEWALTHTCYSHSRNYYGERPQVHFYRPRDDIYEPVDCRTGNVLRGQACDWDAESAEIANEQEELARRLDVECASYTAELDGVFEDQWVEVLARRAVLLEHRLQLVLAKQEQRRLRMPSRMGPEETPLRYIDRKEDMFTSLFTGPSFDLERKSCQFEHHYRTFVDQFATDSRTYAYMMGRTRQEWDSERQKMLSRLHQEIQRLRKVSLEARGWDVDLE